ncbi:Uncharacterised protein r2_g4350 [Pycnogonum litorale]
MDTRNSPQAVVDLLGVHLCCPVDLPMRVWTSAAVLPIFSTMLRGYLKLSTSSRVFLPIRREPSRPWYVSEDFDFFLKDAKDISGVATSLFFSRICRCAWARSSA